MFSGFRLTTISILYSLFSVLTYSVTGSTCICTSVQCPVVGVNTLVMGNGGSTVKYTYIQHNGHAVVSSVTGIVSPASLDKGTEPTKCTQDYSRMLEDDGLENCDAGHIMANRLGGYGNEPINIFPQKFSINRGPYAQFEGKIYECIKSGANQATLNWNFSYETTNHTMPNKVVYSAQFDKGDCTHLEDTFSN
jgi:hypothetical protein